MKLKHFLVTTLLAFSGLAQAQSIKMEMMQINMGVNKLMRANSAEEFKQTADDFILIAEKTKGIFPNSVEGDKAAQEDYQAGMQKLIDVVNQANEKAQAGELQQAKTMIADLEMIKREYHKKYK